MIDDVAINVFRDRFGRAATLALFRQYDMNPQSVYFTRYRDQILADIKFYTLIFDFKRSA